MSDINNRPSVSIDSEVKTASIEIVKSKVVTELVTTHDLMMEDAATRVETSFKQDASLWDEKTDIEAMAEFLAVEDDE